VLRHAWLEGNFHEQVEASNTDIETLKRLSSNIPAWPLRTPVGMRSAVASWRHMLCPRRDSVRDADDVPVANKGPFHSHSAP